MLFLIKHTPWICKPYLSIVNDGYQIGADELRMQPLPPKLLPIPPSLEGVSVSDLIIITDSKTGEYSVIKRVDTSPIVYME